MKQILYIFRGFARSANFILTAAVKIPFYRQEESLSIDCNSVKRDIYSAINKIK